MTQEKQKEKREFTGAFTKKNLIQDNKRTCPEPQGIERIVRAKEQVAAIMEGLAIKDPSFNILVWGGAGMHT